jgi:hypothetical protein
MGREIRMVPANWENPTVIRTYGTRHEPGYQPMYDCTFAEAAAEWLTENAKWEAGERPNYFDASENPADLKYWEWDNGPPDREYYRPWSDDEAVWFQVWETVSEGTPVSPPFATKDELVSYLADHGDFWDQKRGDPPWSRSAAERFVGSGWAPSMLVTVGEAGAEIHTAATGFPESAL